LADTDRYKQEIQDLADSFPHRVVEVEAFLDPTFEPQAIRQERTYLRFTSQTMVISRFLGERGVVELLKSEDTLALFEEIHWCIFSIRKIAAKKLKKAEFRDHAVQCRKLFSRLEAAEEELFIANRRLVVNCAKPFYWVGDVWLPDFLQEGAKALTNAIRKFEYTRGTPFFSYAQISVKNRLRNYFRDHVRAGSLAMRPTEDMKKIKQILDEWREVHNTDPPPNILAKMCGIEEDKVMRLRPLIRQWQNMPGPPASLDALLGDSTANLHEIVHDKKAKSGLGAAEIDEMWDAVKLLPERSQEILKSRFVQGHTLEETGKMIGLTRARIKQIQDDALKQVRHILETGGHRDTGS